MADEVFWQRELGWETARVDGGSGLFTSSRHGDPRPVAGFAGAGDGSGWTVFFAVDDVEAACARVSELDGRVWSGPGSAPIGVTASIEGPHGGGCVLLEHPKGWGGNWVS